MSSEFDFDPDMFMPVNDALVERRDGSVMPVTFPPEVPARQDDFEKRAHFEKRWTLSKPYWTKAIKDWLAKGESLDSFIMGSHEDMRDELRELAEEEGLL